MQKILFSHGKQKIAEFVAETLNFERDIAGLLLSAEGEMIFQDTALLQEVAHLSAACQVTIIKDDAIVIDQSFQVTFFTLEADTLVALLQ